MMGRTPDPRHLPERFGECGILWTFLPINRTSTESFQTRPITSISTNATTAGRMSPCCDFLVRQAGRKRQEKGSVKVEESIVINGPEGLLVFAVGFQQLDVRRKHCPVVVPVEALALHRYRD